MHHLHIRFLCALRLLALPSCGPQGAAAAPAPASLSELPAYPADFLRRRWLTFIGIVLGYSCFYLTRNSLTYTAPVMVGAAAGAASGTAAGKVALMGGASWCCCTGRDPAAQAASEALPG